MLTNKGNQLKLFVYGLLLLQIPRTQAKGRCVETLKWMIDSALTIQLADYAGCRIEVTTAENRILALRHEDGPITQIHNFISIRDEVLSQAIDLVNATQHASKLNVNSDKTVYTTGSRAVLEISPLVGGNHFRFTLAAAVLCPFSIGSETSCFRAVDELSCYCAIYTKRTWADQRAFCTGFGYKFLAVEDRNEELKIWNTFGTTVIFWTSLTKMNSVWYWDSTGNFLSPGYSNWYSTNPTCDATKICAGLYQNLGWVNYACSSTFDAICENHP